MAVKGQQNDGNYKLTRTIADFFYVLQVIDKMMIGCYIFQKNQLVI